MDKVGKSQLTEGLIDADVVILQEAKMVLWNLEQHEHYYDWSIKRMHYIRFLMSFFGPCAALIFLYLRWAVPDEYKGGQWALSLVATGLTVLSVICIVLVHHGQWDAAVDCMQGLSKKARDLIMLHRKISVLRPLDHVKMRKWLQDTEGFKQDEKAKHAAVCRLAKKRGFQHVAMSNTRDSVVCGVCQKEWTQKSSERAKWSWFPFFGCKECGV